MTAAAPPAAEGRLFANVVHFGRALRRAGVPVGPDRLLQALRALEAVGLERRGDVFAALEACLVGRAEHRAVFAELFRVFWSDPGQLVQPPGLPDSLLRPATPRKPAPGARRAADALAESRPRAAPERGEEVEVDATLTFSTVERLRTMDFEQMSADELAAARRAVAALALPVRPLASRRTRADPRGRLPDWRGTLRAALRSGGEVRSLARRARRERWPALVVLCDISGSMAGYSRMLLHFLHAAANAPGAGWSEVQAFTFGTALTNITRQLRQRDVDAALAAAGREAPDWDGGTRIGPCLHAFNRDWSRRVLSRGAVVLLITDGLDREDPERLAAEMERLHLSSRRLIWLNPLLRWEGFAARARGIRAMLPHVDSFRACHSIASLEALVEALGRPEDAADRLRIQRLLQVGG
jgi:uncharacterized protein with von Willebrand factor type A (vWA) domain